jgi:hypothetical protein
MGCVAEVSNPSYVREWPSNEMLACEIAATFVIPEMRPAAYEIISAAMYKNNETNYVVGTAISFSSAGGIFESSRCDALQYG